MTSLQQLSVRLVVPVVSWVQWHADLLSPHPELHRLQPAFGRWASEASEIEHSLLCRGVFGCHTALVMRRLRRLCHREYHTDPRFVITSATIANPDGHAANLLGELSASFSSTPACHHHACTHFVQDRAEVLQIAITGRS